MLFLRRSVLCATSRVGPALGSIPNRQMSSSSDEVIIKEVGDKGVIILNRPKALNALNLSMIRQISPTLQSWDGDKKIILMKGTGEKAFCAGGDVRAVTEAGKRGDSLPREFFQEEYKLNHLIGNLRTPYIAFIHGITMGGGVGLSVHGKYRLATEKTLFAMPETAIGLFPDVGGSHFLPRLQGHLGLYLALTGHRLKGSDVYKAGIATHICHTSNLEELEKTILNSSASDIDSVLNKFADKSPELKNAEFSLASTMGKIDNCFSAPSVEEIIDRLKEDNSKWAQDTAATLLKMSPTSLKITFRQIKEGASINLKECLEMEYRMTQKCCSESDFYEGVRSVLVDRDNAPKWKPASLAEVRDAKVAEYFAPLPADQELTLKSRL